MASSSAWSAALQNLKDAKSPQLQTDAIDRMTELLQQSDWALPEGLGDEIAQVLASRLTGAHWCARAPALVHPFCPLPHPLFFLVDREWLRCVAGR